MRYAQTWDGTAFPYPDAFLATIRGQLVAVAKYTGAFTVYCTPCILDPD